MGKRERALEISLLVAIMIMAALLRLWDLSFLPYGLHGDEAVSGLEAQRIWLENGIGPYTGAALGQPTGPIYVVALAIRVFGDTIFAVRFVSALAGVLTIVVLYFFARRYLGWKVAALAAFLLACNNWHLHFSRIGFPLATWPLFVLLGLWVLLEAQTRRRVWWWMLAGAVVCSGIYIYNAHSLFLAIASLFAVWCLWCDKELRWRTRLLFVCAFGGALLLTALPMIFYALNPVNAYGAHFNMYSLFLRPEWDQVSLGMRVGLLVGRYLDFWDRLSWHWQVDAADGTGLVPQISFILLLFAFYGAFRLRKTRHDAVGLFLLWLLLLLPFAAVITIDGSMRRTFSLAPVLAVLAAFGVREVFQATRGKSHFARLTRLATVGVLLFLSGRGVFDYFVVFRQHGHQPWIFVAELTEASLWMKQLPRDAHVYFLSERWSGNYQTRQFLAPDVWIEDRSKEFGILSLDADDRDTDSVWILLGKYQNRIGELRILHPGGQVITGPPLPGTDGKCFIAYRLKKH